MASVKRSHVSVQCIATTAAMEAAMVRSCGYDIPLSYRHDAVRRLRNLGIGSPSGGVGGPSRTPGAKPEGCGRAGKGQPLGDVLCEALAPSEEGSRGAGAIRGREDGQAHEDARGCADEEADRKTQNR